MKPKPLSSSHLAESPRGHWRGLKLRLGLIRASLFGTTDSLLEDSRGLLEAIGLQYDGLIGESNLFEIMRRLPGTPPAHGLDFSKLDEYIFATEADDLPGAWSSEREVAHFLGELVQAKKAKFVVELGCFIGRTSSYLAAGLRNAPLVEGRLFCVDASAKYLTIARRNLAALNLDGHAKMICGKSTDADVLEQIPGDLDLLFIDSFHDYDNTVSELREYGPKMARDGWIILHDAVKWPGVRKAIGTMKADWVSAIFATSEGNGLAILVRRREVSDPAGSGKASP